MNWDFIGLFSARLLQMIGSSSAFPFSFLFSTSSPTDPSLIRVLRGSMHFAKRMFVCVISLRQFYLIICCVKPSARSPVLKQCFYMPHRSLRLHKSALFWKSGGCFCSPWVHFRVLVAPFVSSIGCLNLQPFGGLDAFGKEMYMCCWLFLYNSLRRG